LNILIIITGFKAVYLMSEHELIEEIVANIDKVLLGKKAEVYNILKGIIAGGHILIEDVPGVGKTTLVKALARTLNLKYSRIQCTPDLLPSDITGISIYNQQKGNFEFRKGPIFANIVLADEINRTSPKTQSALLEVMEESQISEGGDTYFLDKPFIVMATQNPVEFEGTFPLPEAQLDRFMIKVNLGYTDSISESKLLQNINEYKNNLDSIPCIIDKEALLNLQHLVSSVHISKAIADYIVSISSATRNSKFILLGASTRASICLLRIAQANAFISNRNYVIPDDVKKNYLNVMAHRMILSPLARANNLKCEDVLNEIINTTSVPRYYKDDTY
jgi:MoxR-like ATPase